MRRLIHVPILHTAADLGSLAESVRAEYARVVGPAAWSRRQQAVEQLWGQIRDKIEALRLDYAKARVYQDGLPVCGFERQIVEELAKAGSANHQLVLELLGRGAVLMGTEDPQLLVQEYQLGRQQARDPAHPPRADNLATAEPRRLLEARDRFIAARVDKTLQPGETGLLFLGAAHRLQPPEGSDLLVEPLG